MSYLVLARKWRPVTFDEVIGQQGVIQTLKNAIGLDRVAHAYLFCGARGVGKTSVARILAKALNCEKGPTTEPDNSCSSCKEITSGHSSDVFEIDGASNTGVDDVRSLRDNSRYLPASSRFKIYIIDEVHMLSTSAFNALLKTLEEPPAHVKFIFATTEPHKIPLTVLSRCQRFDFKRIPSDVILDHLRKILAAEGAEIEETGLQLIAREASGSVRDSLSLTDQVLAFAGDKISTEQVYQALGLTRSGIFAEVISHVVDNRPDQLMLLVEKLFDEGHDLKRFLEGLLWHIRHLILYRSLKNPDALVDVLEEDRRGLAEQAQKAPTLRWHQIFDVLARALEDLPRSPYPRLVLEIALLRLAAIEPLLDIADVLERVEQLSKKFDSGALPQNQNNPRPARNERLSERVQFVPPIAKQPPPKKNDSPAAIKPAEPIKAEPIKEATEAPSSQGKFPEGWEKLVALVSKRRPSLGSVLNHACPLELSAQKVRISLQPGSFFADQMKTSRNMQELEGFCRELFGQDTQLVVEDRQAEDGVTLAQSWEQDKQDAEDQMRSQALSHPMVKEAIKIFGAEVDTIKTSQKE
ncbi:MAG: DNA polymerase III subunit gamma/tau [Deltaproteobacteria bacterium]|nr:DNA polymerase III subunit gamma/tau [Deltaproteobacteria bacterium]